MMTTQRSEMDFSSLTHALCGASSSRRWMACPGSVGVCAELEYELPKSKEANEGTGAHRTAEAATNIWIKTGSFPEIHPPELADNLALYFSTVSDNATLFDADPKPARKTEMRLTLDRQLTMFGTADYLMTGYIDGIPTGLIVDLKYGEGQKVTAEDNSQLAYYACALLQSSSLPLQSVRVVVVQPRTRDEEKITEVVYSRQELELWNILLTRGAERALWQMLSKKLELVPGEHCATTFCPALGRCSTYAKWLEEHGQLEMVGARLPLPALMSKEQMGRILAIRSDIKKFMEELGRHAMTLMNGGEEIPGIKLVAGRRSRVLLPNSEQELLDRGMQPYKEVVKSVAALEKEYGKKAIEDLVQINPGKPTIAKESDRRERFELNGAIEMEFEDDF